MRLVSVICFTIQMFSMSSLSSRRYLLCLIFIDQSISLLYALNQPNMFWQLRGPLQNLSRTISGTHYYIHTVSFDDFLFELSTYPGQSFHGQSSSPHFLFCTHSPVIYRLTSFSSFLWFPFHDVIWELCSSYTSESIVYS